MPYISRYIFKWIYTLKSPNEVEELYEKLAANNAFSKKGPYKKPLGIHEIDNISKLLAQIYSLEKKVIV